MLELTRVVAQYGPLIALRGVDLEVRKGEITCLLGGNAAGKSSMMKAIIGLLRPSSGMIVFEGHLLNRLPPQTIVRRGIALVPEGRRIFGRMTVWENLMIGAHVRRGETRAEIDRDIERVYGLFPRLRERVTQIAGTLSGGEQQMLAIGRALMARPRLLLLDEPSMGLSPAFVDQVFDIIQEINRQGTTILLVEQNATMALSIAQRGYVLQTGRIVAAGAHADLVGADDVRRAYLGDA
ncbi:MAG: ABC transporter ATP-binding protein [Alphaproteobacteria bacterium]|nr:ABC transporter ATP-binding protein [Alphaproteobacteria bacterium]